MIRMLEASSIKQFSPWDIYSARVLSAWRTYGNGQFWQQNDHQAAISLVDGFIHFSATEDADFEELTAFLQMLPWERLRCDSALIDRLPFPVEQQSMTVRFIAPKKQGNPNIHFVKEIDEFFEIIRQGFPDVDQHAYAKDLALRWQRGTAQTWTLDGMCTASAVDITENFCFLGGVATLPQARGKGLAGQLLTEIASAQQRAGRDVYLSCKRELLPFYEGIGFAAVNDYAIFRKEDNK